MNFFGTYDYAWIKREGSKKNTPNIISFRSEQGKKLRQARRMSKAMVVAMEDADEYSSEGVYIQTSEDWFQHLERARIEREEEEEGEEGNSRATLDQLLAVLAAKESESGNVPDGGNSSGSKNSSDSMGGKTSITSTTGTKKGTKKRKRVEEDGLKDEVKYKGVYKNGNRYRAQLRIDGKTHNHGTFDTPKEAAKAYDSAAIQAGRSTSKLNFLDQVPKNYKPKKTKLRSDNTIGYKGVYKEGNRFKATINIGGRRHHLGQFDTTKEAAIVYDIAAIQAKRLQSDLNFPGMTHDATALKTKKRSKMKNKVPIIKIKKKPKKRKNSTCTRTTKSTNNNSSISRGHAPREFPRIRTESSL